MITINGSNNIGMNSTASSATNKLYNVHNMSPNEMDKMTLEMFNRNEITLRERLPFVPLKTEALEQSIGQEVHLKYYSSVWDDPSRKRDMLAEFEGILENQIQDKDLQNNIDFTKSAISLLKRIEQTQNKAQTFEDILKSNMI